MKYLMHGPLCRRWFKPENEESRRIGGPRPLPPMSAMIAHGTKPCYDPVVVDPSLDVETAIELAVRISQLRHISQLELEEDRNFFEKKMEEAATRSLHSSPEPCCNTSKMASRTRPPCSSPRL